MRALLLGLVSLGVFVAVYLLATSGSHAPVPARDHPAPAQGADEGRTEIDAPADLARQEETSRASAETAPADDDADARPDARQRLSGRLVDALGRPVTGAPVELERPGRELPPWLGGGRARLARATTDGAGRFALDHDPRANGERLALHVRTGGYAPLDHEFAASGAERTDLGDLALDRGVLLGGRVLDEQGAAVEGAELVRDSELGPGVLSFGAPPGERVATSDAAGRFEVTCQAVGPWSLRVRHPEHPDLLATGETRSPDDQRSDLELVLEAGAAIEGQLIAAPPDALASASVVAWPADPGGSASMLRLEELSEKGGPRSAAPDATGRFRLAGLQPGRSYRLQARRSLGPDQPRISASDPRVVAAGARGVELVWGEGAAVELTVLDARSGAPIEELGVRAGVSVSMPLRGPGGATRRHFPGGRVRVDDLRPEPGATTLQLQVAAPGYETWTTTVALRPGHTEDLGPVRLAPVPAVLVTVLAEEDGRPIAGASVELRRAQDPTPGERRVRVGAGGRRTASRGGERLPAMPGEVTAHRALTDGEGRARLSSLPGERARLLVLADGRAPRSVGPLVLPQLGDLEQTVRLAAGSAARVTVRDRAGEPVQGQVIEHERPVGDLAWEGPPGEERRVLSDVEGHARFEHLEPGRHHFRVQEDEGARGNVVMRVARGPGQPPAGEGWVAVDIEPGVEAQVDLWLPARGALRGVVTEGGELLAGARLTLKRQGDSLRPPLPGTSPETSSTSRGRYAFQDVRVGRYLIEVDHATRALPSAFPVEVEEGEQELDLDLPITSVAGRVVDADDAPVPGAVVRAARDQAGAPRVNMLMIGMDRSSPGVVSVSDGRAEVQDVTTDEQGRYLLRGLPTGIELRVEARSAGFQATTSDPFQLRPGEAREGVDVALRLGGTLLVRSALADYPGTLLAVASYEGEASARPQPQVAILVDGEARFEDLVAGAWRVRLQPMGPPPEDGAELPPEQVVEVRGGEEVAAEFQRP